MVYVWAMHFQRCANMLLQMKKYLLFYHVNLPFKIVLDGPKKSIKEVKHGKKLALSLD